MLTPIDIRNRQLKPKMGGYDKKDTDDFLEEIIASYEEMYNENRTLQEKITSLSEGIQYYKKMEGTLQKALVLAEKTSSETQEAAKSQADSMMTEASAKAEALSRETKAEIEALRAEAQAQAEVTRAKANRELEETRNHVRKLVQSYENYRLQFKKLAEAQIEMLDSESFSIFVPELDELMNEAPSADSVMDNPGIIPINIGSPAPFVEPPEDTPAEPPKVEEVSVEAENSIPIPVTSSIEPFTEPQPEDEIKPADVPAPTLDILVNSTPTIDINISSSIGEETEVHTPTESSFAIDLGSINVPVSTESFISPEQDVTASPSIEVPIAASVESTPSVEVPLSFESPADIPAAEAPSIEVPLSFESPADIPAAEAPSIEVPLSFESPADIPAAEAPSVEVPVMPTFEMPAAEAPVASVSPVETPSLDIPMMDIPMAEPPIAETAANTADSSVSTNGLIGVDPMDTMADMSPFMEPGADFPQESPASDPTPAEPSTNAIISDAFLDSGSMFDTPAKETPVEPAVEQQTAASDNFIDINPFNFIDPE